MFNRLNRKSLLSYAIVPFVLTSGSSVPAPQVAMPESSQLIAQSNGWIASFWGRRPRKRLGARGGACAVAPGLLAEQKSNDLSTQNKLAVWHERPMFVWMAKPLRCKSAIMPIEKWCFGHNLLVLHNKFSTAVTHYNQTSFISGKFWGRTYRLRSQLLDHICTHAD